MIFIPYANDVLAFAQGMRMIEQFMNISGSHFAMEHLDKPTMLLNMEIDCSKPGKIGFS